MKKESRLVKQIRDYLETEYGATTHKYHGTIFSEVGHADIYGTLPSGRAYYLEVKTPENRKRVTMPQVRFLSNERKNNAIAAIVTGTGDVDKLLS